MADSATSTAPILNLIAGGCWAQRQLRSGIKDVSVVLRLWKSLTLVRAFFIYTLAIQDLNGRLHYNHCSDPASDCQRLLGSTLAMLWYRLRPDVLISH